MRNAGNNTHKASKQDDDIGFVSRMFVGFLLLYRGRRIPVKYKELYLYVKTRKALEQWVRGFIESNLLSGEKVEQAKRATH